MKARKKAKRSTKQKDLAASTGRARAVKGGARTRTISLSPPSPPAGPIPVPYPN
jgi:hypothetical protein